MLNRPEDSLEEQTSNKTQSDEESCHFNNIFSFLSFSFFLWLEGMIRKIGSNDHM